MAENIKMVEAPEGVTGEGYYLTSLDKAVGLATLWF